MVKDGSTVAWCPKTRLQTVDLHNQGFSRAEIARMTGVKKTSQIKFQKLVESGGDLSRKKRNQNGVNNSNTRVDQTYLDLMIQTKDEHSGWKHDDIRVHVNRITGKNIPYSTFCKWMRRVHATKN
jgi:hypothetical protein